MPTLRRQTASSAATEPKWAGTRRPWREAIDAPWLRATVSSGLAATSRSRLSFRDGETGRSHRCERYPLSSRDRALGRRGRVRGDGRRGRVHRPGRAPAASERARERPRGDDRGDQRGERRPRPARRAARRPRRASRPAARRSASSRGRRPSTAPSRARASRGSTAICRVELTPAANVTLAAPSGSSASDLQLQRRRGGGEQHRDAEGQRRDHEQPRGDAPARARGQRARRPSRRPSRRSAARRWSPCRAR